MGNSDNATTGEQYTGRQRSDSAEPDLDGFPKSIRAMFHMKHCKK